MDENIQKILLVIYKEQLFDARIELQLNANKEEEYKRLHDRVVEVRRKIARAKVGNYTPKELLEELLEQMDIANMKELEFKDDAKKVKEIKKRKSSLKKAIEQTIIEISKTEDITERGIKL